MAALTGLAEQRHRARAKLAREARNDSNDELAKWIEEENHRFLFCDPLTFWPWAQEASS